MIRITNRHNDDKQMATPQIQFVDRVKEIVVENIKTVEVPVEKIVYQTVEIPVEQIIEREAKVNLDPIYDKLFELETRLQITSHSKNEFIEKASSEFNMQRGALVALKAQRDIDRSRRLMLMKRIKKERDSLKIGQGAQKKTMLKYRLIICASLLLSILSLFIKL